MPVTTDILLATYNGAAFLAAQLDSILNQTDAAWHLYIRDDGSTDGTVGIIRQYQSEHPERITFVEDGRKNLGAAGNFSALMAHSTAPYIQFSDQDDIWEPDKTERLLEAIRSLEESQPGRPAYVFSDLSMIDDSARPIADSLWQKEGLNPGRTCLNQLLVQNVPYGCASIVNRALLELAAPVDGRALLHDHWCVLLAASAGQVSHLGEATIRHRIHTSNASRSGNPIRKARDNSAGAILMNKNFDRYLAQLQAQAQAVKERLLERNIEIAPHNVLDDFINLQSGNLLERKYLMIKRGFFKHSKLQSLKWLFRI